MEVVNQGPGGKCDCEGCKANIKEPSIGRCSCGEKMCCAAPYECACVCHKKPKSACHPLTSAELSIISSCRATGFVVWLTATVKDGWENKERGFGFTMEAADVYSSSSCGTMCVTITPSSQEVQELLLKQLKMFLGQPDDIVDGKYVWE